jgi:hypothetical protein
MIEEGRNPLLDHLRDVGPAEDRVWAQIVGLAPGTRHGSDGLWSITRT